MQYGLEKIMLPSFVDQTPPTKLTKYLNWAIDTFIIILKDSDETEARQGKDLIKQYGLNRQKLIDFANTYLDVYGITSASKLMELRNRNILSDANFNRLKAIIKGYFFDHPFDSIGLKSDHTDLRDDTISQSKNTFSQNQIPNADYFDKVFRGILYWVFTSYQTPDMLNATKSRLQAEEKRRQDLERQREQQKQEQQKQDQQKQDQNTKADITPNIDWGVVADLVKNKDKSNNNQAQTPQVTDTNQASKSDQQTQSTSESQQVSVSEKSFGKTLVQGFIAITILSVVVYGIKSTDSKHR